MSDVEETNSAEDIVKLEINAWRKCRLLIEGENSLQRRRLSQGENNECVAQFFDHG